MDRPEAHFGRFGGSAGELPAKLGMVAERQVLKVMLDILCCRNFVTCCHAVTSVQGAGLLRLAQGRSQCARMTATYATKKKIGFEGGTATNTTAISATVKPNFPASARYKFETKRLACLPPRTEPMHQAK